LIKASVLLKELLT